MKQAINTRTQEEYDALREYALKAEGKLLAFEYWMVYREKTCITPENWTFGNVKYFEEIGFKVIPFTEFAKANVTESPNYEERYREAVELLRKCTDISPDFSSDHAILKEVQQFLTNHKDGVDINN